MHPHTNCPACGEASPEEFIRAVIQTYQAAGSMQVALERVLKLYKVVKR